MAAMADYLLLPAIGKQYQPIPIKPDFFCSPTGFIPIRQTLLFPITYAHSDRTDKNGYHHDRKTGTYHCH